MVDQPSEPLPFGAVSTGTPATKSNTAAPANMASEDDDSTDYFGWSIPPVRWGGQLTSNISSGSSGASKSLNSSQILGVQGSSYIYQPWYALVSGNVDFIVAKSSSSDGASTADSGSRSTAFNFGGNLNLFPLSRYPFQAYLQQSDSRAAANFIGTQYRSTRIELRQNWSPELGTDRASGSFDHSIMTSAQVKSKVTSLQGNYSTEVEQHRLNGRASYSGSSGDSGGQGSTLLNLSGNHSWSEEEGGLNISTFGNISNNKISLLFDNGLSTISSQLFQLGTSVGWQPDEEIPLSISFGANMIGSSTTIGADSGKLFSVNAFANTQYQFSSNLSASGGLTLLHSRSSLQSVSAFGQNASLSYNGDPLAFAGFSYNWGVGTSLNNQFSTPGVGSINLSGSGQHGVSRIFAVNPGNTLSLYMSQGLSYSKNTNRGEEGVSTTGASLSHSVGASWQVGISEGSSGSVSSSFSDSVTRGESRSHYRNFSAQGNLQTQLSRWSSFTIGLNLNGSQQLTDPTNTTSPFTEIALATSSTRTANRPIWSGSGSINYNHRKPFGIANLAYSASLQANLSQTNLRVVSGDPNALFWQTGTVFQQSVEYRLGLLNFRGGNTITSNSGVKNFSVFGTVTRRFGNF